MLHSLLLNKNTISFKFQYSRQMPTVNVLQISFHGGYSLECIYYNKRGTPVMGVPLTHTTTIYFTIIVKQSFISFEYPSFEKFKDIT